MDTNVRVLVANRPRLMRELVLSTLYKQTGIRVVGEAKDEQDVPSLVAETKPDFLLIALDESHKRPALCDLLLKEFPALRIIAVSLQCWPTCLPPTPTATPTKPLLPCKTRTLEERGLPHLLASLLRFFQPATLSVRNHRGASHV